MFDLWKFVKTKHILLVDDKSLSYACHVIGSRTKFCIRIWEDSGNYNGDIWELRFNVTNEIYDEIIYDFVKKGLMRRPTDKGIRLMIEEGT